MNPRVTPRFHNTYLPAQQVSREGQEACFFKETLGNVVSLTTRGKVKDQRSSMAVLTWHVVFHHLLKRFLKCEPQKAALTPQVTAEKLFSSGPALGYLDWKLWGRAQQALCGPI